MIFPKGSCRSKDTKDSKDINDEGDCRDYGFLVLWVLDVLYVLCFSLQQIRGNGSPTSMSTTRVPP